MSQGVFFEGQTRLQIARLPINYLVFVAINTARMCVEFSLKISSGVTSTDVEARWSDMFCSIHLIWQHFWRHLLCPLQELHYILFTASRQTVQWSVCPRLERYCTLMLAKIIREISRLQLTSVFINNYLSFFWLIHKTFSQWNVRKIKKWKIGFFQNLKLVISSGYQFQRYRFFFSIIFLPFFLTLFDTTA